MNHIGNTNDNPKINTDGAANINAIDNANKTQNFFILHAA